jgi:flagellin-specific chaperone FliS
MKLVSTCLAINQTDPQQEKDHIYAIANSISNLNNALNFHHEAFQDAATQLGHLWPYMEDAFTWKDQVKEYETNRRRVHNDFISFWYKVVNNIFSDLSALNGAITQAGGPDDYGPIAAVITMWIRLFQQNLDFVEFFHKLHLMRATLP